MRPSIWRRSGSSSMNATTTASRATTTTVPIVQRTQRLRMAVRTRRSNCDASHHAGMIGHMRRLAAVVFLLALAAPAATAQSSRMIRVGVDFRQTAQHSRDAGLSVERRVNRSTGVFTLVQDGGEATLTVAAQI